MLSKQDKKLYVRACRIYDELESRIAYKHSQTRNLKISRDTIKAIRCGEAAKRLRYATNREASEKLIAKLSHKFYSLRQNFVESPIEISGLEDKKTWINNFVHSIEYLGRNDVTMAKDCLVSWVEDVELDGLLLGDYKITIDVGDIPSDGEHLTTNCVGIEARSNNYASHDGCIHPHISSKGDICLGEAKTTIRASLLLGDLVGVFDCVESFLRTYNNGSAYCRIDNWDGTSYCDDCGEETDSMCSACDSTNCCGATCSDCDTYFCSACKNDFTYCACCSNDRCKRCFENLEKPCHNCGMCGCYDTCKSCNRRTCSDCDTDWCDDLCKECYEERQEAEEESEAEVEA